MSDNVGRLRDRAYSTKVGDESTIEIVRLRWRLKIRENIIGRLVAQNQRLRLREDEREAIEQAIDSARGGALAEPWTASALRLLLTRTK
jgi:hypothetical protein